MNFGEPRRSIQRLNQPFCSSRPAKSDSCSHGLAYRHYLFSEDGSLKRIPQRIADALPFGRDAIPEYAGTTQRVARVIVELEDARPVRILDARGFLWEFDEDSRVDEDIHRRLADRIDLLGAVPAKRSGAVVDLVPELKRRELDARDRWTLTGDDIDRIAADLWPGTGRDERQWQCAEEAAADGRRSMGSPGHPEEH